MEAGPSQTVPTVPLVEERLNLINRMHLLPQETQFEILGQMKYDQLINVCLTNTEMLNLCLDPYLKIVKQWTNLDFIIFKLKVLDDCDYKECQIMLTEIDRELDQYDTKELNEYIQELIPIKLRKMPGIKKYIRRMFYRTIGIGKIPYYYITETTVTDDIEAGYIELEDNEHIESLFLDMLIDPSEMISFELIENPETLFLLQEETKGEFARWGSKKSIKPGDNLRKFIAILDNLGKIELIESE